MSIEILLQYFGKIFCQEEENSLVRGKWPLGLFVKGYFDDKNDGRHSGLKKAA
jgi:hypothetical protein